MRGRQFADDDDDDGGGGDDDDDEVKELVPKWLCPQPKAFNSDAFQRPVDQWTNCIENQRDYVEV
jgi:hypothetical protein